jgi:NACHT domain/Caspase domain
MRHFITIGSPECPLLGLRKLAKVEDDVKAVAELLGSESQGYGRALAAELPLGTPSGVIKRQLGKWFLDAARTEADCVVIYVAGHGDSLGQFSAHCLLTSDTEPRDVDTVVKVEELVERIFAAVRYPRNVLLILDVCFAGKGAGEAVAKIGMSLKKAFPSGAGLWVVATADRNSEADDGAFVRAWQALMADKNGAWLSPGGKKYLYMDEFVVAVNDYLGPANPQRVVGYVALGPDEPTFIKNPWYTPDLDGVTVDIANHWAPKARGDDTRGITGPSYFTGRGEVLAACRAWLQAKTSDGLARVVTGAPGSGKSAVLGQVVLNPGESAPPLAKVHARGQQAEEVAAAIAKQLACKETKPDGLVAELAARPHPVSIVLDSLDEAANSAQLERDLLRGLAACPQVRLIVGVRSRSEMSLLACSRVDFDLDNPAYFDTADVEGYSFALLTATRDGKPRRRMPPLRREKSPGSSRSGPGSRSSTRGWPAVGWPRPHRCTSPTRAGKPSSGCRTGSRRCSGPTWTGSIPRCGGSSSTCSSR